MLMDSVAFHFRHNFEDLSLRTRLLTDLAQNLAKIARQYNIAVSSLDNFVQTVVKIVRQIFP